MKKTIIVALALLSTVAVSAQEKEESKFGVKFSGFVKNDFFWDTRQTVAAREGHFLLWPTPVNLDENGEDINKQASFNFLAIQSRLTAKISGPDALGAKISGLIEGDFFAQSNFNINLLRLRHAFVKLNWEYTEVMAGQYWNPLFVTACFPGTVSFNTGTPLQSFARNPQIRVTHNLHGFSILAAVLGQRDYASQGPLGPSSRYLRNSAVPEMQVQVHYGTSNDEGMNIVAGAGAAYKSIVPRLSSSPIDGVTYKVDEKVRGFTAMAFSKLTTKPITAKLQVRYGENISDVLGISGFAATEIVDVTTGELAYAPLKSMTFWAEVHTNGNPQVGVFGGLTSNNGVSESILVTEPVYGLGTSIRRLYRIAPRIIYNVGKLRLAAELEYTSAAYGDNYDEFYIPADITLATNLRVLTAVYYFF
ncbi:MAG: hypothetical protein GQ579_05575 [Bacteroidales bacterium]|nr:hypothetical protein [Bacteroidales bacterium]